MASKKQFDNELKKILVPVDGYLHTDTNKISSQLESFLLKRFNIKSKERKKISVVGKTWHRNSLKK